MRVQLLMDQGDIASAQEQQQFAHWLQRIGEGTEPLYEIEGNNCIRIPDDLCVGCRERDELDVLIQEVHGDLQTSMIGMQELITSLSGQYSLPKMKTWTTSITT